MQISVDSLSERLSLRKPIQRWHIGVSDWIVRIVFWFSFRTGNYWIVNQIISKKLHETDDEAMIYTTNLMDGLEQVIRYPFKLQVHF